ncbi:uncharacterized protein LOC123445039 [Hordeum vulgare subsp. vulgare]|uniref:Predicted protein n=1 Tax=Hordeum vulgare subsp. vulgare TaxID=112509 RepID=F2E0C8_HORVV|nr:uncharacterized protein LOC123445039 [Hordeum vulgare subsp. vulgare]BAK00800.1 predicted protein [Hordeum vulgare subsp. vulgare]
MPGPSASAPPCRFAARWAADALAGDEALDFSFVKALVGVLPESLAGAPEATRDRVALRCLREVVSLAAPGEGEVAATPAVAEVESGTLRVDASRSCEELLIELLGQVGSSGSLEKDMLPPFSKDIQKFICIKTPALPETSFELLREVNPDIACMVAPPPVEKGGKNIGNDQLLCGISPDHVNTERHGCPTNRCYDRPQEDTTGAVGVSVRSAQTSPSKDNRNMSITAEPASASCSAAFLPCNTELMPKQNVAETTASQEKSPTTILQRESCGDKYKNSSCDNDGERSHGNGTNIHLSKNLSDDTVAPDSDRSTDALLANTSETRTLPEFVAADGTGVIAELHGRKTRRSSPQHDSSEKASHVLDEGSARIQPVEKGSGHNEQNLQTAGVVPSVSCNRAVQGDKYETNLPQENATGLSKLFKEKNDKALLEVSCADKANPALHDDGNILENDTSSYRKTSLDSSCCNAVETSNVHRSNDSPGGFAAACLLSLMGNMPSCSQDKEANGSTEGFTEQDLCIKCGKDGQLLKCSSCSLIAHDRCFGSSVTLDVSGQFYCPVCFYTKATEAYQKAKITYLEARKNLSAFLGTKQFPKEHHEQSTGKRRTATNSKDHSNGFITSKRQDNHQSEADDLSCKDEEPGEQRKNQRTNDTSDVRPEEGQLNECDTSKRQGNHQPDTYNLSHNDLEPGQQRKKQRTNATSDTCPGDVITEKASFGLNSDIAPNRDCVLQNKRKLVEQSVESAEAHEDGNGNSFYDAQHSSQNRCSPVANQSVEAEKHDSLTNSHDPKSSDEIEATSSNNSGKGSSPPWRNMRRHKARFHGKETVVSYNSKKALQCQDQQMPSSSSKQNYAYQPKHPCNPLAPAGRRSKLCWTEEEEQALRDAMLKFTPKDGGPIPWVQILESGRGTFHKKRLASDLRVKWRNMTKKSGS